jgi:hypothetical protein
VHGGVQEVNDEPDEGDDSSGGVGGKKSGAGAETDRRFCEAILEAFTDRFFPLHGLIASFNPDHQSTGLMVDLKGHLPA